MVTLENFKIEAFRGDNICDKYKPKWERCSNKKQLIDLSLCSSGTDYLCDAINKGWGISPSEIVLRFSSFINGKYISVQKGYDSEMYCGFNGNVIARTTVLCIIDSEIEVAIPKNDMVQIFVVGNSKVRIKGEGRIIVYKYGNNDLNCEDSLQKKIINKTNRDD